MKSNRNSRRMQKSLVAAVVGVVTVIGVGSAASANLAAASANPAAATGIAWGPCDDPGLASAGAQCGFLSVPLDYAHPAGATIQLAVSRIVHTTPDAQYQGVMLANPGGPGGSGIGMATLGQLVPNGAGNGYDWIGIDPRGVGSSVPTISCQPDYFGAPRPPYVPSTPAVERAWLARTRAYDSACVTNGPLLRHMTTADSARDMESLRIALGASQINFFGYSYGTYVGQVYATLYPTRVRRMVLDSTVDPRYVWYQTNLNQDVAFERNVKMWFGWLAQYDSVYHLGTTPAAVEELFYQSLHDLDRQPAGGVVGGDEWSDIFLYAGYWQFFWPTLADVFASWVHDKNADILIGWYLAVDGPGDDNAYAVYNAVQCTDVRWPTSLAQWHSDIWATYQKAPFGTWLNAWYNAPCLYWPAPAGNPVRIDGQRVASVLLVGETLDAATPFAGSLEVRRLFPNSSLLAEPGGTSHASSLFLGNACVDGTIADYLATGALPARKPGNVPDATCAPVPLPVPTAAAAPGVDAAKLAALMALTRGLPLARWLR